MDGGEGFADGAFHGSELAPVGILGCAQLVEDGVLGVDDGGFYGGVWVAGWAWGRVGEKVGVDKL